MTGARANRVVVRTNNGFYEAEFFKTHKHITTVLEIECVGWTRDNEHTPTQSREAFRSWVQEHAFEFGVDWSPELQAQSWDRHYWKYETDEQVEEDAYELMHWTIAKLAKNAGEDIEVTNVTLDAIIPGESNLSYVENGRYTKNGNWAVATVRLAVELTKGDTTEEISYDIEMRSGQLTKIKMNKDEFKALVADVFVA